MPGYITTSESLKKLASNDAEEINRAVLAASQIIDEAFSSSPARYKIPLNFDTIIDPVLKERFQGRIEQVTHTVAAYLLSQGEHNKRGVDNQIVKSYDEARKWLDKVARGSIGFAYLTAGRTIGFVIGGTYEWGVDPALYDTEQLDIYG